MDSSFFTWAKNLVEILGYPGIFLTNFLGSATILFPLPVATTVFIFGAILNPWLVAIFAAVGCALGETVGYGVGLGGGKVLEKKYGKFLEKGRDWVKGGWAFPLIVLFAAIPLPDDVVGILGGMFNYSIKKFILASFFGKLIMNLALAFGGSYGISWILNIFKSGF